MNTSGEAADQVVRMTLNGVEVAAKLSGAAAKQVAIMLYAILKDQKRTKGKMRLSSMLRSGKELRVFAVQDKDLQKFCEAAKQYGILYCVLKDKNPLDGMTEIMAKAEDAAKINHIFERFKLATVDMASVKTEITKTKTKGAEDIPEPERTAPDRSEDFVDELMKKLSSPMQQAVTGALNRSSRRRNPRYNEIDWKTTIEKNLRNYQPEYKTIIPEVRIGFGRKRRALKDIVLCLDQSGSMGASVVYSGIFGSVLASIPSVQTRMVVFDTSVVDLTDDLQDPVDLLFGVQLGGGTDIDRALGYCQTVITRPADTVLVLVTDLCEGGNEREMRKKMISLVQSGVQLIVLLALNDDGAPFYDKENAQFLAELGVPAFACTPDKFPDLMAAALAKQDIGMWLSKNIQ